MEGSYDATSYGYLRRALLRLADGTREALFYEAFELRCGIEAKLKERVEALDYLAKRKKKGWKIKHAWLEIAKAFKTGDKVIEYVITGDDEKFTFSLFYIPLKQSTRDAVEKQLPQLLHAMPEVSSQKGEAWWDGTRSLLIEIADDLADANRGTLMGLMFEPVRATPQGLVLEPGEKKLTSLFLVNGSDIAKLVQRHFTQGKPLRIEPRVWNGIPEHAQPFLNPIK